MLNNIRAIRSRRAAFLEAGRLVTDLGLPPAGTGNLAFFLVRAEIRQAAAHAYEREDPGHRLITRLANGMFKILARNEPHGAHSEVRCIAAFNDYFARRRAEVVYVFTEREPCHEGAGNCLARLEAFLANHGAHGLDTPVRFVTPWESRAERGTQRRLGGAGRAPGARARRDVGRFRRANPTELQRRIARAIADLRDLTGSDARSIRNYLNANRPRGTDEIAAPMLRAALNRGVDSEFFTLARMRYRLGPFFSR